MKCAHCSTPISRTDWFCPNCKRGIPRPAAGRAPWIAITGAVVAGIVAGGLWVGGSRRTPAPVASEAEALVPISIRTLDPTATPSAEERAKAALQAPQPRPTEERREAREEADPRSEIAELLPPREPGAQATAFAGVGAVSVTTDSDVETFVYLNGGSLLGKAPIQDARIPAGRQKLVFWSPSVGGRSTREVDIRPGQNMVLIHNVAPSSQFSDGG